MATLGQVVNSLQDREVKINAHEARFAAQQLSMEAVETRLQALEPSALQKIMETVRKVEEEQKDGLRYKNGKRQQTHQIPFMEIERSFEDTPTRSMFGQQPFILMEERSSWMTL